DLYLLHWRDSTPLEETVDAFIALTEQGKIRHWGVSNFDVDDLDELSALDGGSGCALNQVYQSVSERGPEYALLPWQQQRRMPLMAYSPIDQGALAQDAALQAVARRHGATAAQVALAALWRLPGVMPIPKTSDAARLLENWQAQALVLDAQDQAALDAAHPAPRRKTPLQMR
ncbi:MAG: aldo/keto reductase, partial [Aquabacterium sp.]